MLNVSACYAIIKTIVHISVMMGCGVGTSKTYPSHPLLMHLAFMNNTVDITVKEKKTLEEGWRDENQRRVQANQQKLAAH